MSHYGPELNTGKNIFVFGSNLAGRHGAGAALEANKHWGAIDGVSYGMAGQSFAIPTKDWKIKTMPLESIELGINAFLDYSQKHPDLNFLVTKIGCGLAGYKESDIKPFFKDAPKNCQLPEGWR